MAIRFNTHTHIGFLTLLAGVAAYFLFYGVESIIFGGHINHLFVPSFKIKLLYVIILFNLGQVYVIERLYKSIQGLISDWLARRKEEKEQKEFDKKKFTKEEQLLTRLDLLEYSQEEDEIEHIVFLVHGFQGSSWDLQLFRHAGVHARLRVWGILWHAPPDAR